MGAESGDDGTAEPDALEIVQFARYLGMDPIEDCAFLWIAEQALVAPLPRAGCLGDLDLSRHSVPMRKRVAQRATANAGARSAGAQSRVP